MAISCGCKGSYNSSKLVTLFLVFLFFIVRACCDDHQRASKRINCLESERRALLAIKSDLYNSDHWLSSWIGDNCCKWRGVACDNTTDHVIKLDLHYPLDQYTSIPYKSKVNPSLFELKYLKYLDLSSNNFSTHMPRMISSFVHIEHLNLSNAHFNGLIPQQLGNLTGLLLLDLSSNEFYGCIPDVLGNLINLEELLLSDNNISCQIPGNIGRLHNLLYFDASWNNLMGQIPLSLGDLCNLKFLDLSENNIGGELTNLLDGLSKCPQGSKLQSLGIGDNKLTGHIPLSLGDLCNLEVLDLSRNNIGGELTNLLDGLSKCPQGSKLRYLHINDNKLSGSIPSSLGKLAQLQHLDVSSNSLQGNMTEAHFSQLTNLKSLDISYNSLNLILSDDWLPPFHASWIHMSYCHLGTRFPSWIQTQTTLLGLDLSGVGLYGNIPSWFSNFIFNNSLFRLDISSNNLNGQLPSSLSVIMDLSNNSFEGTIPLSYTNFEDVQVLRLSNNHIHGSLPACFCNFTNLHILHLSNNYLSGEVPNCHDSYLISLNSLHLNNNNLSGPFPSILKHCNELIVLDLGGNKFSGAIPKWVGRSFPMLRFLRLSSNSFHGAIPMSRGNLTFLQVLDLSSNNFIGSIPSTFANFSFMDVKQDYTYALHFSGNYSGFHGCKSCYYSKNGDMEYFLNDNIIITAKGSTNEYTTTLSLVTSIDLSNNKLSGEIPKEITKLHGLYFLNLSNNHLIGRIPENIGVMIELESLDLSMNRLIGEIPYNLSSLNFLSFLNLSYNNLSGRIPTGGQFSTFSDSIYAGNKGLCGVPLPECPNDEANHSPSQTGEDEDGNKPETIMDYAFILMGFIVGFWAYFVMIIMNKAIRATFFQLVDKIWDKIYGADGSEVCKDEIEMPKMS